MLLLRTKCGRTIFMRNHIVGEKFCNFADFLNRFGGCGIMLYEIFYFLPLGCVQLAEDVCRKFFIHVFHGHVPL